MRNPASASASGRGWSSRTTRLRSSSLYGILVRVLLPSTSVASSSASTASTRPARANRAAPAWAWPSSSTSCRRTADACGPKATLAPARNFTSLCRLHPRPWVRKWLRRSPETKPSPESPVGKEGAYENVFRNSSMALQLCFFVRFAYGFCERGCLFAAAPTCGTAYRAQPLLQRLVHGRQAYRPEHPALDRPSAADLRLGAHRRQNLALHGR